MISLFTLIIFVKQTNIIERQSRLSVMPYLVVETSNNSADNAFRIDVENLGVGPAIIESKNIRYQGENYDMEFPDFLRQMLAKMDSVEVTNSSTLQKGLALPAGAHRNVLTAGGSRKSYLRFLEVMGQLQESDFQYEIVYRSIYGDRWKIDAQGQEPIPLEE